MGVEAIRYSSLPPFIDNSCRREPDFQNPHPSITALCRGQTFAPRLRVGDLVLYMTVGGVYPPFKCGHHLVAVLQVKEVYETHQDAKKWYEEHGFQIPANCMVPDNPPCRYEMTAGKYEKREKHCIDKYLSHNEKDKETIGKAMIQKWDEEYRIRAEEHPVFVRTAPLYIELLAPQVIRRDQFVEIFGKVPVTQTPINLTIKEFRSLMKLIHITVTISALEQSKPCSVSAKEYSQSLSQR